MSTIAIIGQSNGENIWARAVSGLTPAADTWMWNTGTAGGWQPPVNHLITFCNSLKAQTEKEVRVLPCAINGTTMAQWLDTSATGALGKMLAALSASGASLSACWFIHGEQDASIGITAETYRAGLIQLQAAIAAAEGKSPQHLPFLITPLGITEHKYPYGRQVFTGQMQALSSPGMLLGPDHYDLPTDEGTHLSLTSIATFVVRGATALVPIVGVAQAGAPPPPTPPAPPPPGGGSVVVTPVAVNTSFDRTDPEYGLDQAHLYDGNDTTHAVNMGGASDCHVSYDFGSPKAIRHVRTMTSWNTGFTYDTTFNVWWSDTGLTGGRTVVGTHTVSQGVSKLNVTDLADFGAHRFCGIERTSPANIYHNCWLAEVSFST